MDHNPRSDLRALLRSGLSKSLVSGTNTVSTDATVDLASPLYYWNNDTWSFKAQ